MTRRPLLIVILAAGKGTRMKSAVPKVMHEIAGRTMLGHALNACQELGAETIAVVVGADMEDVRA
ncbi:MAG: NTP transferase domain-containing protein, partial [Alphaproteobacteria bacterium]